MEDGVWRLDEIGDFIFLLNCYGPNEKNVLQRRFKKDRKALNKLYDLLEKLDELGFDDAMSFGQSAHYIGTIANNKHLTLIEIRVKSTLWRVSSDLCRLWEEGSCDARRVRASQIKDDERRCECK